jgi:hypothetical protein
VVVAIVRAADPGVSATVVADAVERVAVGQVSRARLADYLTDHPEALTSGHSSGPKVVGVLIAALVEAGSSMLVVPRCAECDREVELLYPRGTDERICGACRQRANTAECVDCGRVQPVTGRTADRGARCARCYSRARAEACGTCGRVKPVAGRNGDGSAVCSTCQRRDTSTWEDCADCGRRRPVNARTGTGAGLCSACYTPPADTCAGCGKSAAIASRTDDNPLCKRCYRQPRRECGGCGRTRRVAVRGRNGQPGLCPTCHQGPVLICGVEDRCRTTTVDRSPICYRCQLARRLDELLTGPSGRMPAPLAPLREAILGGDNPTTALTWLRRSPAIGVLTAMAKGDQPLTHATLDTAGGARRGRAFAIEHLRRQLLVTCGALPERDRHLARLEVALEELVDAAHPEDQKLLRTYATWWLLHRLRRKAEQGQPTQFAAHRVRELTAEAARFLAWLRERHTSPAQTTQADLDIWLTIRPQARRRLPGFLRWAHAQRLLVDLDAAYPPASDPIWFIADDQRWDIARRLLADDTLATRDRVAALLLLLYAQPAARITRLTRADLQIRDADVQLRLGEEHVVLPPPLSELIERLPEQTPAGMAGNLAKGDLWLFPGRRPGHPMDPTSLSARLRKLAIEPRAARNTALLQLGAELPRLVFADLLGVHINTAEHWSAAAGPLDQLRRHTVIATLTGCVPTGCDCANETHRHGVGRTCDLRSSALRSGSRQMRMFLLPATFMRDPTQAGRRSWAAYPTAVRGRGYLRRHPAPCGRADLEDHRRDQPG